MSQNNSVSEQFIEDYLLVAMNDEPTYKYLVERVKALEVDELASELEEEFEEFIMELTRDVASDTGRMMVRQMLLKQGSDTYYQLAKQITEMVGE